MSEPGSANGSATTALHASGAEQIVGAWIDALPAPEGGRQRSEAVVAGYRVLARAAVRHGLEDGAAFDEDGPARVHIADLDRMLAGVAAASRRSGLSISDLLEDLRLLTPATLDWLERSGDGVDQGLERLRATTRIVLTLDVVARRIVRVLEANAARARREQAAALSAMTDMVSHELRNRLGAAQTASQMLGSQRVGLDEDGLRRAAELVQTSVEAALRTVDDVRALATSHLDASERTVRTLRLPVLIRAVIEEERLAAEAAGVRIEMEGEPVECRVDAARMRLIVFNLIDNGIKYRDDRKERPFVRVRCERRHGGRVAVRVSDNGVGIPTEEMEDIFVYRARGSETSDVPGSGLGLAIVSEAVDQMGGEIAVESEPAAGTTFTLVFQPLDGGPPDDERGG